MNTFLFSLSLLGIAQTVFLAIYFLLKKRINQVYSLLSILCFMVSMIMLAIVLPNGEVMNDFMFYELLEYIFTLSFGPFLYLFCCSFLGESTLDKRRDILVHFIPVILYMLLSVFWFLNSGEMIQVPIWIPLIHLQLYTVWLIIKVYHKYKHQETRKEKKRIYMLGGLSSLLIVIHVLQWVRFFYSEFEWSGLVIPISSFLIFYLLILYGFIKSVKALPLKKKNSAHFSDSDLNRESENLDKFITEKKIYREQDLTIDLLAEKIDIPSYKVSYLINNTFGSGFNDFINKFRIDEAKRLLSTTEYDQFTIEAISQEVGFNSRSTFYAAFKRETGVTPTIYKNKICSNL